MKTDEAVLTTQTDKVDLMDLGAWLGRHQAFGLVANRCSAADAECLKQMRESGEYKKLGLRWADFCKEHAGISRAYADRLIRHLEEFGANYFRLAELIPISGDTYRLIAGAVSDQGIEIEGKRIPFTDAHRKDVVAAVESLRTKAKPAPNVESVSRRLKSVLEEVETLALTGKDRLVLAGVLEEAARRLNP